MNDINRDDSASEHALRTAADVGIDAARNAAEGVLDRVNDFAGHADRLYGVQSSLHGEQASTMQGIVEHGEELSQHSGLADRAGGAALQIFGTALGAMATAQRAADDVLGAAARETQHTVGRASEAVQAVTNTAREQVGTAPQDPQAKDPVGGGHPSPTPSNPVPHPPATDKPDQSPKAKREAHSSHDDDHRPPPPRDTPGHHDTPAHRTTPRERQSDGPSAEDNLVSRDSTRETADNGDVIVTHHDREVRSAEKVGADGLVDHRSIVIDRTTVETTHRDGTVDRTTTETKEVVDKDANAHGVKVDDHAMGSRVTEHVDPNGGHTSLREQSSDSHLHASYDTGGRLVEGHSTQVGDASLAQASSHPSTAPEVTTPASPRDWHGTSSTPGPPQADGRGLESEPGASPWGTVNDAVTDPVSTSAPAEVSPPPESGSNHSMDLPPS